MQHTICDDTIYDTSIQYRDDEGKPKFCREGGKRHVGMWRSVLSCQRGIIRRVGLRRDAKMAIQLQFSERKPRHR